jgi:tetraacyldisaccharide 4'-kinase
MMPAGDLRDTRSGRRRADIIIVTKCKKDLSIPERDAIKEEIDPLPKQQVYFTEMVYKKLYHLFTGEQLDISHDMDILLLCGVANPRPLKEYITHEVHTYDMLRYSDHHIFTIDDLKEIKKHYKKIQSPKKIILTTEKDGVRLEKYKNELIDYPVYVLPVEHRFLFNEAPQFGQQVFDFVNKFERQPAI